MTQHTQPVVAGQHQQQQQQQQQTSNSQQQQQHTTTNTCSNNNNNTTPATSNPTTNNNQTQTVAVQQQQQSHPSTNSNNANNNNNSYQSQQQNATVGQVFNPQLQTGNVYVPTHGMPAHHHPQHHHHQPGAMYQTMIPAAIPSNVYVNNVTANVNLHGWTHTVPHSAWVHPSGAPHYIHGDLPQEQSASVIQPMGAIPVALSTQNALTGSLMNPNASTISAGARGNRRGRGRGGGSGSRRADYNIQRHPQPEGSPAPQISGQTNQQEIQQQQQGQQQTDAQQMMTTLPPSYVPHPQYTAHAPQYPYAYPTFFAPQQHMIHPGQSTAAQQATGTPLYFSAMPVYNGTHMYNYGYYLPPVMNPSDYQYGEEVGVDDERQTAGEGGAMMWQQQPIYSDEYGMSPADIHAVASDDMNHNASSMGSATETPTMLSPNYAPMYEQMTQQMGVVQIYEDPQMTQMQVIHSQTGLPQMEEEISECGSQTSASLQMVPPIQMIPATAPPPMALPVSNPEQILHQTVPHLIPVTGGAIMSIDGSLALNTTPQHHIQQHGDNTTDASLQTYENISNLPAESFASLNEEIVQQPAENNETEYHRQTQQRQQQQQQQSQQQITQTSNFLQEEVKTDNFKSSKILTTSDEQQESSNIKTFKVTVEAETTCRDVAIETTTTIVSSSNQQQTVYQQQSQEKYKQQHVTKQNISQQHQQYQHQQAQTMSQQQQQQNQQHQPQAVKTAPQQQQTHYQTSSQHHHHQQQQQQNYENRKSSQTYNQQHQSRSRKYEYHHSHGSSSSNNDNSSHQQHQQQQQQHQHQQQSQQTTKTMSWTNSAQHKKSTNTVAVTATPTTSHTSGGYNKQSNTQNSSNSHAHGSRTYSNQHNYHQSYHYQQQQHQPQTRNYGAMKMPSSPISSASNTMERKTSQSSDKCQTQQQSSQTQSTSTASTTAAPHQFQKQQSQQTSTTNDSIHTQPGSTGIHTTTTASTATTVPSKQQSQSHYTTTGYANKKHSFSNQGNSGTSTPSIAAAVTSVSNTVETPTTPAINLAPPVTNTTPPVSSTPSWASLFASNTNTNNSAFPVTTTTTTAAASNLSASTSASTTTIAFSKKPVAKVAPYEGVTPVTPPLSIVTPGTLSYSAASAQNLPPAPASTSSSGVSTKKASLNEQQAQRNSLANLDEYSIKFADFLTKYKSDWTNVSLKPRGLTNRSNYCYINSILQALLGCSPLYNLIRSIPKQAANLCEVKTPTINAMITFMSNFSNLPGGLRLRNTKGSKGNKDDLGGDLQCDSAFEPTEIYKLWNDSREEHVEGRQEDAEEFLSYILNKLNDEMLEVIKLIARPNTEQNGPNEPVEEEGDVWQMICNNRNKGSVTRQTDFGCTPLSDIFRGELRSRLQREGEHSTDVIQPFFTLQLNIEKAASVKEALEILVGRDQLEGVTGSKSKQEVVAWQQMNLEKLPPILILHLKWFDYRSDGCTKILKKVEFPVELKIDTKILASKKYSQKQRAYRLFAVVYHDGKEATKGHYITDVYHNGYGSWLRYDDSSVKPVNENHVLLPRTPRVPYLLCYRRCDTIPQQSNNNQQNSSTGNNNNSSGNTSSSALAK